jgi:hypothetical protein
VPALTHTGIQETRQIRHPFQYHIGTSQAKALYADRVAAHRSGERPDRLAGSDIHRVVADHQNRRIHCPQSGERRCKVLRIRLDMRYIIAG